MFSRATEARASGEIAAPLATYDFTRFATIADIGGGRGHRLPTVLDAKLAYQRIRDRFLGSTLGHDSLP